MANNLIMVNQTNINAVRPFGVQYEHSQQQGQSLIPVNEIVQVANTINHTIRQVQSVIPVLSKLTSFYR